MLQNETSSETFTGFVAEVEPRLQAALIGSWGLEGAREATAEALAYAWEHWEQLSTMENPAGYLYRVAQSKARRLLGRKTPAFPAPPSHEMPWVEPGLPAALAALPERQRVIVLLVHSFGWTQAEVTRITGLTHGTVQKHCERGLSRLRNALGGGT
jgi:DNA-directed RNA polymerase specialized sigma24 family protein